MISNKRQYKTPSYLLKLKSKSEPESKGEPKPKYEIPEVQDEELDVDPRYKENDITIFGIENLDVEDVFSNPSEFMKHGRFGQIQKSRFNKKQFQVNDDMMNKRKGSDSEISYSDETKQEPSLSPFLLSPLRTNIQVSSPREYLVRSPYEAFGSPPMSPSLKRVSRMDKLKRLFSPRKKSP